MGQYVKQHKKKLTPKKTCLANISKEDTQIPEFNATEDKLTMNHPSFLWVSANPSISRSKIRRNPIKQSQSHGVNLLK